MHVHVHVLPLTSVDIIIYIILYIIYVYIQMYLVLQSSKSSVFLFGKSASTKLKYCLAQIISHIQKLFRLKNSEYRDLD